MIKISRNHPRAHAWPNKARLICVLQIMAAMNALLEKYNRPVPRYTSYPTVPFWEEKIDTERWKASVREGFTRSNTDKGISLYLHLPFCESLCTYCGCNKKITRNHGEEDPYLETLLREYGLYLELGNDPPLIRSLHLGGGTPTFFSPANLQRLITNLLKKSRLHPEYDFSIEGHPNNTSREHLETLHALGFNRISFGVQDLDRKVQRVINRMQPFEQVKLVTEQARAAGFRSVNFDLIYGLPLQTLGGMKHTIRQVLALRPDRIAFYSYAHVPWTSRSQRLFDENDLPSPAEKLHLYQTGRELLLEQGYHDIGMDHFALPTDELYLARQEGRLYRNFMGYTVQPAGMLLGLGVSAISDTGNAYAQNDKQLHNYRQRISQGQLAVQKGYFLNEEDVSFRQYILDLACTGKAKLDPIHLPLFRAYSFPILRELEEDGLITWNEEDVRITGNGKNFIRNICRAFDLHLLRSTQQQSVFSKAI